MDPSPTPSPPLSPTAVAVSIALVLFSLLFLYRRLRVRLPPGPYPLPIVGNLYSIKPVRFRCYTEWAEKYGPIISVWIGSTLNVVVSNTELARQVLKDQDQQLANRHRTRSAEKFSRNGQDLIWADYGPHYVKVRKMCTLELFTPKRLEGLRPIREDEVTAMVEAVYKDAVLNSEKSGKPLTVKDYLSAVAFHNITRLAFGKRFVAEDGTTITDQGLEFKSIVATGLKLGASLATAEHIPWLRWMFPLEEEAFAKHGARRDRLTKTILDEHAALLKAGGVAKHHFVDALLTLKDQYDLSDDTVIGLMWDMVTAGMDTTAISTEWAMAELVRHPEVQTKAQEELDRVVGRDRVMTEADFSSLPYLQAVTKEALRLHPTTPLMLPHRASADVKIGGYDVPKGSNVHVNVWAVARDPAVWKDPLQFKPERFFEEDVDVKGHDFRLLPFGAGRRVCPGAQLGLNLVQSMLGHLLHHFRWEPAEGVKGEDMDMGENPGLVAFMRSPLKAVATPRLPAHLYKRIPADL